MSTLASEALAHLDALFHVARYLTGDDGAAEDLVQETYARALGAEASFARGTNLRAWLMRILRNAFIDQTRRDARVRGGLDADEIAEDVDVPLRSFVAADLEKALLDLSPDARATILLDLEGLSEAELAEAMGCAPGTIKSRLARARAALRARLSSYARSES
ncbi:MAG TPA: RNA polymerase sigma factor [Polyangiaceae bacterium]|jgi:RNA polymerase sigma-70 factor (ECF subfamily)